MRPARVRRLLAAVLVLTSPVLPAADLDAVMSSLWNALSSEPGQGADAATLERLFHAEAHIYGATYKDGEPNLVVRPAAEFIRRQAEPGEKGFHECEIAREVKHHDRFASVYSVVESRTDAAAASPDFTGVNSVQLFRDEGGDWRIIGLYYHVAEPGTPVAAPGGRSGLCLNRE